MHLFYMHYVHSMDITVSHNANSLSRQCMRVDDDVSLQGKANENVKTLLLLLVNIF